MALAVSIFLSVFMALAPGVVVHVKRPQTVKRVSPGDPAAPVHLCFSLFFYNKAERQHNKASVCLLRERAKCILVCMSPVSGTVKLKSVFH